MHADCTLIVLDVRAALSVNVWGHKWKFKAHQAHQIVSEHFYTLHLKKKKHHTSFFWVEFWIYFSVNVQSSLLCFICMQIALHHHSRHSRSNGTGRRLCPKGQSSTVRWCATLLGFSVSLFLVFSHKPYGNPSKQTTAWFTKRLCINGMLCMLPCIKGTHTALRVALMDGPLSSIFIKVKQGLDYLLYQRCFKMEINVLKFPPSSVDPGPFLVCSYSWYLVIF